jgi:hypothetical protein
MLVGLEIETVDLGFLPGETALACFFAFAFFTHSLLCPFTVYVQIIPTAFALVLSHFIPRLIIFAYSLRPIT